MCEILTDMNHLLSWNLNESWLFRSASKSEFFFSLLAFLIDKHELFHLQCVSFPYEIPGQVIKIGNFVRKRCLL